MQSNKSQAKVKWTPSPKPKTGVRQKPADIECQCHIIICLLQFEYNKSVWSIWNLISIYINFHDKFYSRLKGKVLYFFWKYILLFLPDIYQRVVLNVQNTRISIESQICRKFGVAVPLASTKKPGYRESLHAGQCYLVTEAGYKRVGVSVRISCCWLSILYRGKIGDYWYFTNIITLVPVNTQLQDAWPH